MTNRKFDALFGQPPRTPEQLLTPFHMDIAASIQQVTEEILLRMTRPLAKETGERNLCLAGGVALNCVANGKVLRDRSFENIWIQPAAGDAGGASGLRFAPITCTAGSRVARRRSRRHARLLSRPRVQPRRYRETAARRRAPSSAS
jgi:predicted NodU family carbamoyl transferase